VEAAVLEVLPSLKQAELSEDNTVPDGQERVAIADIVLTDEPEDGADMAVVVSPAPLPLTVIVFEVSVQALLAVDMLTLYVPLGILEGTENVAVVPPVLATPSIS
jgi:hypothetical protein